MKSIKQVNVLFSLALIVLVLITSTYFFLSYKLKKEDIDKLLAKSLTQYVLPGSMKYDSSELKIRNNIRYSVKNLEMSSPGANFQIDYIRFEIPYLALLSRRRIRTYLNQLIVNVDDSYEGEKFVKNKKEGLVNNEISLRVKETIVNRGSYSYKLKNTHLRNINHPSFTNLKTEVILSESSKLMSALKFWGEISFKDLFAKKFNIEGYAQIESDDPRIYYMAKQKLKIKSVPELINTFEVYKSSQPEKLSFILSLAKNNFEFKNVKIKNFKTKEFPAFIGDISNCDFSKVDVRGNLSFLKNKSYWSPELTLGNECSSLRVVYDKGYKWSLDHKNMDSIDLEFHTETFDINELTYLDIKLKKKFEKIPEEMAVIEKILSKISKYPKLFKKLNILGSIKYDYNKESNQCFFNIEDNESKLLGTVNANGYRLIGEGNPSKILEIQSEVKGITQFEFSEPGAILNLDKSDVGEKIKQLINQRNEQNEQSSN